MEEISRIREKFRRMKNSLSESVQEIGPEFSQKPLRPSFEEPEVMSMQKDYKSERKKRADLGLKARKATRKTTKTRVDPNSPAAQSEKLG